MYKFEEGDIVRLEGEAGSDCWGALLELKVVNYARNAYDAIIHVPNDARHGRPKGRGVTGNTKNLRPIGTDNESFITYLREEPEMKLPML